LEQNDNDRIILAFVTGLSQLRDPITQEPRPDLTGHIIWSRKAHWGRSAHMDHPDLHKRLISDTFCDVRLFSSYDDFCKALEQGLAANPTLGRSQTLADLTSWT
jgi:hypothetical protein